ncbi:MAG: hypothetical protein R3Y22_00930 [Bacteroidales bacterium]
MSRITRYSSALKRYHRSNGHGIHSPFAFHFVTSVLRERTPYYAYKDIEGYMNMVKGRNTFNRRHFREVKMISFKCAKIIFRLINHFQPSNIFQISGNYGIITKSIMYANSQVGIYTYEATFSKYELAGYLKHGINSSNSISQSASLKNLYDNYVEATGAENPHFIVINDIRYEREFNITTTIIKNTINSNGVIIMRNLHTSTMGKALWDNAKTELVNGMTFTNGKMGIIISNPKLPREDFTMWF